MNGWKSKLNSVHNESEYGIIAWCSSRTKEHQHKILVTIVLNLKYIGFEWKTVFLTLCLPMIFFSRLCRWLFHYIVWVACSAINSSVWLNQCAMNCVENQVCIALQWPIEYFIRYKRKGFRFERWLEQRTRRKNLTTISTTDWLTKWGSEQ